MRKMVLAALAAVLGLAAVTANAAGISVHDPSVIKDNGTYYIFGSHITAAKSDDLINWKIFTNGYAPYANKLFGNLSENLAGSFAWAGEDDVDCAGTFAVWAPDVYYDSEYKNADGTRGAYLMYYSASSTYVRSCIGLAVSKNIEGPYEYVDTLIYSGFTQNDAWDIGSRINKSYKNTNIARLIEEGVIDGYNKSWGTGVYDNTYAPNCIDPCIYKDAAGGMWMVYGSWSGGIFTIEVDPETGLLKYPGRDGTTTGGNPIDRYFGVRLAGGKGWSGEGPYIYYDKEAGYYYLQDTYEWLGEDGGYHIRVFRSKNPDGPFTDTMGRNAIYGRSLDYQGLKLFGNYRFDEMTPAYKSGGHSSVLIDDDGKRYLFYHTRFSERGGYFESRVHRMFVNEDGWIVVAPYRYLGDEDDKESFDKDDITGRYQYIDHGSAIGKGAGYEGALTLRLNSDGTVGGAEKGLWETDGKNITLYLSGGVYKGVLYRQKNENGEPRLTFSAVGNNNSSIWGVKDERGSFVPQSVQRARLDGELSDAVTVARPGGGSEVNPVEIKKEVAYEEGIGGKALKMDGTFGLKLPKMAGTDSYSVSLWIKPESLSQFGPIVAVTPDFVSGTWLNMTTVEPGYISRIWSRRADIDLWSSEDRDGVFELGNWQHMIISVDGTRKGSGANTVRASLYINGARVSEGDAAMGIMDKGGSVYIGANAWDAYFKGLVSDIRVFDSALDMAQAEALYKDSLPYKAEIIASRTENGVNVRTPGAVPSGVKLIATAYKGGALTEVKTAEASDDEREFKFNGGYDKLKIFLWNGIEPVAAAVEI